MIEDTTPICDSCKAKAHSQIRMHSWYGSKFDMTQSTLHLCDKCYEKARNILEGNFNIKIKLETISEI